MRYLSRLPQEKHLLQLARRADYPVDRDDLIRLARQCHLAPSTMRFLRLFDRTDVFMNGIDFMNRCEEIKLLIREARHAQPELVIFPEY